MTSPDLVVLLEARLTSFERQMKNAGLIADRNFGRIERRSKRASSSIQRHFAGVGRGIAASLGGAVSMRAAQQLVDSSTRITNSLKVAGLAGEDLTKVYDELFASAQRNAVPLESLSQLFSRVALVQDELNASTEDMLTFTENVSLALRVAGTDAQSASGALLQLSQAMGSGVVRAEEFNSILEGALPIAQAAAAGLDEAGGSVAKLRQLVVDGKVSSEAFFRAFEAGSVILETKVADAEMTISQQFVRLQNVLIDVARKFNEGTEASEFMGQGVSDLADMVSELGEFALYAVGPLKDLIDLIGTGATNAQNFAHWIAQITGLEQVGASVATFVNDQNIPGLVATSSAGGRVIDQTFSLLGETPEDEALASILAGNQPAAPVQITVRGGSKDVEPVSLADYPVLGGKKSGAGAGARRAEIDAAQALIAELEHELRLIGLGHVERRVENELRRAGADATDQQKQSIRDLATQIEMENAALETMQNAMENASGLAKDFLGGLLSDLRSGVDGATALANAFGRLADKLMDMALDAAINSLFSNLMGSLGGGLFGGLFGFSEGGIVKAATGGLIRGPGTGTSDSIPARLSDGEFVVRASQTAKHLDLLRAINDGKVPAFAQGGLVSASPAHRAANSNIGFANDNRSTSVNISAPVTVNATGGTPAQNEDLARQVSRQLHSELRGLVMKEMMQATRPGNFANSRSR